MKNVAKQAGWIFSETKKKEPSKCFRFLGYNLKTETKKFEVPVDKIEKALQRLSVLLGARTKGKKVTARQLAMVDGGGPPVQLLQSILRLHQALP